MDSLYEDDKFEYDREHEDMFGHRPVPDLSGRRQCIHPMHDALRAMMESPGVNIEVPFDFATMISDDDEEVLVAHERYEEEVDYWRDEIKRVEAEEARKKKGKTQW